MTVLLLLISPPSPFKDPDPNPYSWPLAHRNNWDWTRTLDAPKELPAPATEEMKREKENTKEAHEAAGVGRE